jgi:hypothetical protein
MPQKYACTVNDTPRAGYASGDGGLVTAIRPMTGIISNEKANVATIELTTRMRRKANNAVVASVRESYDGATCAEDDVESTKERSEQDADRNRAEDDEVGEGRGASALAHTPSIAHWPRFLG